MFEILLLLGFLAAGTSHFIYDLAQATSRRCRRDRGVGKKRPRTGIRRENRYPTERPAAFWASSSSKASAVIGRPKR